MSIADDKITLTTLHGNKADVPLNLYAGAEVNLGILADVIDSAAAYATAGKPEAQETDEPCHARVDDCCRDRPDIHVAMPTVTLNEINGGDEEDEGEDPLEDYAAEGDHVPTGELHGYVQTLVSKYSETKSERDRYSYLAVANRPEPIAPPTLIFAYVDANGDPSIKQVELSLDKTTPANDWFTTYTDGQYRNFRYDRITSDYVIIKD